MLKQSSVLSVFALAALGAFYQSAVAQDVVLSNESTADWRKFAQENDEGLDSFSDKVVKDFEQSLSRGKGVLPSWVQWRPKGEAQWTEKNECEDFYLRDRLATATTFAQASAHVRQFFSRCEKTLARSGPHHLWAMAKEFALKYDFEDTLGVESFNATNPDGQQMRLHLLRASDSGPRPLVVVLCGIFCNSVAPSQIKAIMQLSDEAGFHVLLKESITGSDYQKRNETFSFGGFDEGRNLFQTLRYIKSRNFPLSQNRIASVHVVANSHGSHSALFAAVMNSESQQRNGRSYLDGVYAGCVPVDLKASVQSAFRTRIAGGVVYRGFQTQLLELLGLIPIIGSLLPDPSQQPSREEATDFLARAALDYHQRWTQVPSQHFAPFTGSRVREATDFWQFNNWNAWAHLNRVPMFMWSSFDDPVVRGEQNLLPLLSQRVYTADPKGLGPTQGMLTPKGGHCNFESMYGWRTVGTIIRGLILAQSPIQQRHQVFQPRWLSFEKAMARNERRVGLQWRVHEGALHEAELISRVRTRRKTFQPAGKSRTRTVVERRVNKVDMRSLSPHLPQHLRRSPRNQAELERLNRWLNANFRVSGATLGQLGPRERPQQIDFYR